MARAILAGHVYRAARAGAVQRSGVLADYAVGLSSGAATGSGVTGDDIAGGFYSRPDPTDPISVFARPKATTEFREWLESVDGTSEKLPEGSFQDPSLPVNTGVNARMVVIDNSGEFDPENPSILFSSPERRTLADFIRAFTELDGAFQYTPSMGKTLDAMADTYGVTIRNAGTANVMFPRTGSSTAAFKYEIRSQKDGPAAIVYVEQNGDRLYLDASSLESGVGRGSEIYAMLFNYAINTNKVFIGDPNGLSDAAVLRRTEAMASAALKWGTTRMMEPHPRQLSPGRSWATRLRWDTNNHEANTQALLETSYHNTRYFARDIDNVALDFDRKIFRRTDGSAARGARVGVPELDRIAGQARKAFAARPGAHLESDDGAGEAAFGRATIARAILAATYLRATSGAAAGSEDTAVSGTGDAGAGLVDGAERFVREMDGVETPREFRSFYSLPDSTTAGEILFSDGARESWTDRAKRLIGGKLTDWKPALLAAIPLNYLGDFAPKAMTAVQSYLRLRQNMDTMRNDLHGKYDAVAHDAQRLWCARRHRSASPAFLLLTAGQA